MLQQQICGSKYSMVNMYYRTKILQNLKRKMYAKNLNKNISILNVETAITALEQNITQKQYFLYFFLVCYFPSFSSFWFLDPLVWDVKKSTWEKKIVHYCFLWICIYSHNGRKRFLWKEVLRIVNSSFYLSTIEPFLEAFKLPLPKHIKFTYSALPAPCLRVAILARK